MTVRVQQDDFDVGREIELLTRAVGATHPGEVGGIASFIGVVRRGPGDSAIESMTLEHYPAMTEKELVRIEAEARARWPIAGSLIIHRYGRLVPGDRIVLVVTASAHRQAAFEACEFLVDWLKTKAPFWKNEESAAGPRWVAAQASDDAAAQRWSKDK